MAMTWKVCSTQGLIKSAGQGIKTTYLSKVRCRILSDLTDVMNSFAIFASVKLLWNVLPGWPYIGKGRLQGIPQNFYCNYPKNSLSWNSVYPYSRMVSYDFFLFMLKIETSTGGKNSTPFLVFRRDHLRSTSWIICGSGSFAVQFGNHFLPEDHLRSGIICGAVQIPAAVCPLSFAVSLCIWLVAKQ